MVSVVTELDTLLFLTSKRSKNTVTGVSVNISWGMTGVRQPLEASGKTDTSGGDIIIMGVSV